MKFIKLTQGKFAQVDDWWFEELNQHKWFAHKARGLWYAHRKIKIRDKQKTIYMHRVIMNTPENMLVDHIDHDGLNCLEENMRNCTSSQNQMNKKSRGKSPYLGVVYKGKCIVAQIKLESITTYLGTHPTEELAALAYDVAAMKHHGEFANCNFS
jgi:hypothetical protein